LALFTEPFLKDTEWFGGLIALIESVNCWNLGNILLKFLLGKLFWLREIRVLMRRNAGILIWGLHSWFLFLNFSIWNLF